MTYYKNVCRGSDPLCALLAVLILVTALPAQARCPESSDYTQVAEQTLASIFYRVHDCQGNASYVLGTLHSSDNAILESVGYAVPYLQDSEIALFEVLAGSESASRLGEMMKLPPSQEEGLRALIGRDDFRQMVAIFQRHGRKVQQQRFNRLKPWAATIALQVLSIDTSGVIMDHWLEQQARKADVATQGLETAKTQLGVFDALTVDEQVALLRDAINNIDRYHQANKRMVTLYQQGQLRKLAQLSKESFTALPDQTVSQRIEQRLVHQRNRDMAEEALPFLRDGGAFIAVGALHLPGQTGLLQGFERRGFRIEAIPR